MREHTLIRVMVRLSGVAWNHLIEDTMQLWSTAHRNSALKDISRRKHQIEWKEMVEKMRRRKKRLLGQYTELPSAWLLVSFSYFLFLIFNFICLISYF